MGGMKYSKPAPIDIPENMSIVLPHYVFYGNCTIKSSQRVDDKKMDPLSYLKNLLEDITHAVEREDEPVAVHHVSDIINLKNVIKQYEALEIEVDHLRAIVESCECNK